MKIIIDTEKQIVTEEWAKADEYMPWSEIQKNKVYALGLALAGQMVVTYKDKFQRERVLAKIFNSMLDIMDQAKIEKN